MIYQNISKELKNCNIRRNFLCKYHQIDTKQVEQIRRKGELLYNIFSKINALYRNALIHNDKYLLGILESGMLKKYKIKKIHRRFFLERAQTLPLLFRGDTANLEQFVEFNVGLEGLGYVYAFREIMEKYYGENLVFNFTRLKSSGDMFVSALQGNDFEIAFLNSYSKNFAEVNYFLKKVFKKKIVRVNPLMFRLPWMCNHSIFGNGYMNNYRFRLLQIAPRKFFISISRGIPNCWNASIQRIIINDLYDILERYSNKEIEIEPPPNFLYEQKAVLAIVWDPKYKDYFAEEEKSIFPESYLIKKDAIMKFGDREYSLQDIIDMPRKNRTFIVKYAGLNFRINWGGRSVYRLKTEIKKRAARIIKAALLAYERYNEPWILQRDICCTEQIRYFDLKDRIVKYGQFYKLYRPYFIYNQQQNKIDIIDIPLYFRNSFNVYGNEDSIYGLVSLSNFNSKSD